MQPAVVDKEANIKMSDRITAYEVVRKNLMSELWKSFVVPRMLRDRD